MRSIKLLIATFIAAVLGLMPAQAEKRVALIIGNSAYSYVPPLTNPKNDATDIKHALERLGFDITKFAIDATADDMRNALLEFGRAARDANIAVVFFAGHGIEVNGENWLIPTNAQLRADTDVDNEAISLRSVLNAVGSAHRLGLVILDSCRDNPFAPTMQRVAPLRAVERGLKPVEPTGSALVAYAAKGGTTAADGFGRNSPFSTALLRHLETPGLEIGYLFRIVRDDVLLATNRHQEPFIYGSLSREEIYLKAPPIADIGTINPAGRAWDLIKDTADVGVLNNFVRTFPDSPEATVARGKILRLATLSPPPINNAPPCHVHTVAAERPRAVRPLAAAEECALIAKDSFRECTECPEMVVVPAGSFTMGSAEDEPGRGAEETPQHVVTFEQAFAIGKFEVTVDQFAAFVRETRHDAGSACDVIEAGKRIDLKPGRSWRNPGFPQGGNDPAVCLSWNDAKAYVAWLERATGRPYRLLSEAEWEYAARARTTPGAGPRYSFGNDPIAMCGHGNAADEAAKRAVFGAAAPTRSFFACPDGYAYTAPVGSFAPNGFALYDMHGNVWEWVEDCYAQNYAGAPSNGTAYNSGGDCRYRVLRGGSFLDDPATLRIAYRFASEPRDRTSDYGLRVARSLTP